MTVNGPLKKPQQLSGTAELNNFDVKLQGIELKSAGPVRVSLRNGVATLDQVHITGQDTDLTAGGTVQAFGASDPNGGGMNLNAKGSISVALAHTFDPDILSSGKIEFTVAAGGQMKKPSLTGHVQFDNVNLAMRGDSQWPEQSEWNAGVQPGSPAGREADRNDRRRAAQDRRLP